MSQQTRDQEAAPPPLDGVLVIDIGHIVAGPMVASILGDFGAEIIKVEHPERHDPVRRVYPKDGIGLWSKTLDRNKAPITLDLKHERGRELLERLVSQADVLVENFRPGVLERLGFAPERLRAEVNPGLVVCRVSGWGQTGPWAQRRGYGRTGEAGSGFAHLNGNPDGPPMHSAASLGDTAGAIWAAFGVMLALRARDRDGQGQVVDIGLNEALLRMIEHQVVVKDQLGRTLGRVGNQNPGIPTVNVFRTADGKYYSAANATPRTQQAFIRLVGLEGHPELGTVELAEAHRPEFNERVSNWMAQRTLDEVDRLVHEAGAVGTAVWTADDIVSHPQLVARGMIQTVADDDFGTMRVPGIVPRLTRTPGAIRHTGRGAGAANRDVLQGRLGLDADEIEALRAAGII